MAIPTSTASARARSAAYTAWSSRLPRPPDTPDERRAAVGGHDHVQPHERPIGRHGTGERHVLLDERGRYRTRTGLDPHRVNLPTAARAPATGPSRVWITVAAWPSDDRAARHRDPVGKEPDVRFSYANERTFLAWNRTSLALIATGLAVVSLLPKFNFPVGRRLIGVPLIALGAALAIMSYRRWAANERAMRLGEPLPPSNLSRVLALGIAIAATIAAVVAAFGAK